MGDGLTYRIIMAGDAIFGFELETVKKDFAALFKLEENKAEQYFVGKPVVLKGGLDHRTAEQYREALEKIGAVSTIERMEPEGVTLRLAQGAEAPRSSQQTGFACPKCGHEQTRGASCVRCGIIFERYVKKASQSVEKIQGSGQRAREQKPTGSEFADPIEDRADARRSFPQQLPRAFLYPFLGNGKFLLLSGTVFFAALDVLASIPILEIFIGVFVGGYLCAYMMKIMRTSADGSNKPPEWPEFFDWWQSIARPLALTGGAILVSFCPALIYWYFTSVAHPTDFHLFVVLVGFGILYLPMALLAVALYESLLALNPLFLIGATLKVGPHYLLACILLALVFVFSQFLQGVLTSVTFFSVILARLLSLYLLLVEMRVIGIMYRTYKSRLNWLGTA
jgi:predicted RNA-binding Zn-ribbon protein involved in translation (DUF1610 family)